MTRVSSAAARFDRRWIPLAWVFFASGVAAVGASYIVAGQGPAFVVTAVAATVIFLLPDPLLTWSILNIAEYARDLLVIAAAVGTVCLFATIAAGTVWLSERLNRTRADALFAVGLSQALLTFALTIRPLYAVVVGAAGGITVAVAGAAVTDDRSGAVPGRRRVLRSVGVAAGTLGVGWLLGPRVPDLPEEEVTDEGVLAMLDWADDNGLDLPEIDPLVSRNFFQVDINTSTPVVERDEWALTVEGGPTEFTIDYDALTARTAEHRFVTLRCVSDPLNGGLLDTALWTGIPISDLLEEAEAPERCCVRLEGADGYYQAFPREALDRGFLAWRMNGKLLPRGHGHPVRALIPGHWGEINVKWITRIEILAEPATGYWEERGWHGTGPVETVAKLHAVDVQPDGSVVIGGHAYAGTRGVERVEVSVDGGGSWNEAQLSDRLPGPLRAGGDDEPQLEGTAADAWRQWRYEYEATNPHEAVVRAIEPDGTIQPETESEAFPSGATGWVRRKIEP